MTVKELIEALKQFDENMLVVTNDNEYGRDEPYPREVELDWDDRDCHIPKHTKFIEL